MKQAQANLQIFMLTQDLDPEHWHWNSDELKSLSSSAAAARVIVDRFIAAGFPLQEAHAIEHNMDEKDIWDKYQNIYNKESSKHHLHFVAKLGKANALPLETIASIAGVDPNFIERPRTGRWAYDNMLAYMIHIKYPSKFQYDPNSVVTLAGKNYMDYYYDRHKSWIQGRAKRVTAESNIKLEEVQQMIMDGKLSQKDLLTDPQYRYVYMLHKKKIDTLIDNVLCFLYDQQNIDKDRIVNDDKMLRGMIEVPVTRVV